MVHVDHHAGYPHFAAYQTHLVDLHEGVHLAAPVARENNAIYGVFFHIKKDNGKYKGQSSGITNFSVFDEVSCN